MTRAERAEYQRKWRATHPEKVKGYESKDRVKHAERRRIYSRKYRAEHLEQCKASMKSYQAMTRFRDREKVLDILGGACECCGFCDIDFLTIDHINGGGTEHRKQNSGRTMWEVVAKEGCPTNLYRILCTACNIAAAHTSDNECPCDRDRSKYI